MMILLMMSFMKSGNRNKLSDLIDRLRIEAKSMGTYGTDYMATLLTRSANTIEMLSEKAKEPKHGEWIDKGWHGDWQFETDGRGNCWKEFECSNCNKISNARTDFCPNCGARMKGADDE